jgi:hypothetical protein
MYGCFYEKSLEPRFRCYLQAPDGTRKPTVITPGFYDLMADWAKGGVNGAYGQAYRK